MSFHINFRTAVVSFDLAGGTVPIDLGTFIANLSQAAGLCAAYEHGSDRMRMIWTRDEMLPARDWRPGCQRNAPGYVEKLEVGR